MRGKSSKHYPTFVVGLVFLGAVVGIIFSYPPEKWFIELVVTFMLGLGLLMTMSMFIGRKFAAILALGLISGLILNRLGILEPLTILLLVIVLAGLGSV